MEQDEEVITADPEVAPTTQPKPNPLPQRPGKIFQPDVDPDPQA